MTTPQSGESVDGLQRLAYQLHYVDKLPWSVVADELDEPMVIVKEWAQTYIERTDAAADAAQPSLFG